MDLKTEIEDLEWSLPWWSPYKFPFRKWYKYYCGLDFHPDYSSKASLIQPQYTVVDPDKEVEVIQNLTTASLELHSTKQGGGVDGNYRVINLIFKKYGNLPLCLENYTLFSLPPIFTNISNTYPLRDIIYLGEPSGNFNFRLPWHIYIYIHALIWS